MQVRAASGDVCTLTRVARQLEAAIRRGLGLFAPEWEGEALPLPPPEPEPEPEPPKAQEPTARARRVPLWGAAREEAFPPEPEVGGRVLRGRNAALFEPLELPTVRGFAWLVDCHNVEKIQGSW